METLWYTGPSGGEHVPNPTAAAMVELLRRGAEYWGQYSPMGVLCWHDHADQPTLTRIGLNLTATARQQLLFIRHPKRGWYFEFSTDNLPERRWLVPLVPGADPNKYVRSWGAGQQFHFLAGCFAPQAVAEHVVADFVATREPSGAVPWVPFEGVSPRLDPSEYRARRR